MRILHVTNLLHPDAGGPPLVAINLAAAQARLGHHVSVLGHCPRGGEAQTRALVDDLPFNVPIHLRLLPLKRGIGGLLDRPFAAAIHDSLKHTDLLILHGIWDRSVRTAIHAAQHLAIPYVLRPAGALDPWSLQQKLYKKRLYMKLFFPQLLGNALFLHATSDQEAANLRALLRSLRLKTPVHIIPNGVFLRDIENLPPHRQFHADHPQLQGNPYVLFLGRLHYKKRPDLVLRAFTRIAPAFPDLQLVIAGPDSGETPKLLRLAHELDIAHRIYLPGPLYGPKKFAALVDAACFCLPSHQENFGIAVMESLAAGTPVVISDQVQIWPAIVNAGAGIACPLDVERLAAAMQSLLSDEENRRKMGQAGQDLARRHFLWRDIGELSITCYTRALHPQSQPVQAPHARIA